MEQPILHVNGLTKNFGGLKALDQLDLEINRGEIVALIGPNGAGKTTFFNCITGIYEPSAGEIFIAPPGQERDKLSPRRPHGIWWIVYYLLLGPLLSWIVLSRLKMVPLKPNEFTERGMARTFQNIRLFQNMTVLENVMIGRHCRLSAGIPGAVFRGPGTRSEEKQVVADSYRILEKLGLERFVNDLAKNLPYGAQRRLEIARALATEPFLLLLDEPAAGMNPQETRELDELILRLRDEENLSILLIEHDMKLVMSLSDRIYVMDYGKKIAQGTPDEIKTNPAVITAYLGEEIDA